MSTNTPLSPRRIILTLIGDDRPGIVDSVALSVSESGGNWMESRMIQLGGQFAGLVQIEVPSGAYDRVFDDLKKLELAGLTIGLKEGQFTPTSKSDVTEIHLDLVSPDRPGILREITGIALDFGVSIEELDSEIMAAPWSGELLFKANLRLRAPKSVDVENLRDTLEAASAGMMLDLSLSVN